MTRSDVAHYDGLEFWGPYDAPMIDALVSAVTLPERAHAVDIGCGDGALLLRVAATHECRVTGIDRSEAALDLARTRCMAAGIGAADWRCEDASALTFDAASLDAICWLGGPFVGDSHARTLEHFGTWTTPGGWLLLGQGYWISPPPAAYLDATGLPADTLDDEATMLAAVTDAGFDVTTRIESSRAVWDHFEGTIHANHEAYAAAHAGNDDVEAMIEGKRRWAAAQERWGRDVMGFALYAARRA